MEERGSKFRRLPITEKTAWISETGSSGGHEPPNLESLDNGQPSKPDLKAGVFVVEDQMIVREGLRALLNADPRVEVLGEACSGRLALERLGQLASEQISGVVLMDLAMPVLNGLSTTRQIITDFPRWRVLVLSGYCGPRELEQAINAGASGCIPKETSARDLITAVLKVHKGGSAFGEEMLGHLLRLCRREGAPASPAVHNRVKPSREPLTHRETEVLQLVAEGYANKQIGAELGISIKTVEKHRQHLMDKLNLHETAGLTRYAMEHRVVETCPRFTDP